MFAFILSLSLFVGQQTHLYHSENVHIKEAPAFVLQVSAPSPTLKTVNPPKPVSKPQPKPLRIDMSKVEPLAIEVKNLPSPSLVVEAPKGKTTETVYFDFDSYLLKPSERTKLDGLSRGLVYEMTGYTCDIGSKDYNDGLALKRAEAVKEYLGGKGRAKGEGKCCYADKKDRSKNRRVEIKPLSVVSDYNIEGRR